MESLVCKSGTVVPPPPPPPLSNKDTPLVLQLAKNGTPPCLTHCASLHNGTAALHQCCRILPRKERKNKRLTKGKLLDFQESNVICSKDYSREHLKKYMYSHVHLPFLWISRDALNNLVKWNHWKKAHNCAHREQVTQGRDIQTWAGLVTQLLFQADERLGALTFYCTETK